MKTTHSLVEKYSKSLGNSSSNLSIYVATNENSPTVHKQMEMHGVKSLLYLAPFASFLSSIDVMVFEVMLMCEAKLLIGWCESEIHYYLQKCREKFASNPHYITWIENWMINFNCSYVTNTNSCKMINSLERLKLKVSLKLYCIVWLICECSSCFALEINYPRFHEEPPCKMRGLILFLIAERLEVFEVYLLVTLSTNKFIIFDFPVIEIGTYSKKITST